MGEESEKVLASVTAVEVDQWGEQVHNTEQQQQMYDSVIKKFEKFFHVRKNVIFERARSNRQNQVPDESAEEYIMALYKLAEDCKYGEMIRDRLVVGIRDSSPSERLQLDPKLTLESAKKAVRERKAVKKQQKELSSSNTGVDTVQALPHQASRQNQPNTLMYSQKTKNGPAKQLHVWRKSIIRRMLVQLELLNVTTVIAEVIIVHNVYLRRWLKYQVI